MPIKKQKQIIRWAVVTKENEIVGNLFDTRSEARKTSSKFAELRTQKVGVRFITEKK